MVHCVTECYDGAVSTVSVVSHNSELDVQENEYYESWSLTE